MGSTFFQGGEFVELLSAQGKAPASTWKLQGKITKSFDKTIRGNAFVLDGSSDTKMQLPKTVSSTTTQLGLTHRFLVLQLLIPHTHAFSLEVGYADFQKIRRRLVIASAFRDIARTTLHVQIPLGSNVVRDQWINLVVDAQALSAQYFTGSSFRSIESICIGGNCRVKRLFTMRDAPRSDSLASKLQILAMGTSHRPSAGMIDMLRGIADMKEIPKQFLFASTMTNATVPTEYFLPCDVRCEESSGVSESTQCSPTPAARKPEGNATARDVKRKPGSATAQSRPPSNRAAVKSADRPRVLPSSSPSPTKVRSSRENAGGDVPSPVPQPTPISVAAPSPVAAKPDVRTQLPSTKHLESQDAAQISNEPVINDEVTDGTEESAVELALKVEADDPQPPATCVEKSRSPDLMHASDSLESRRLHRQDLFAAISSTLDSLTKDAEDEQKREADLFLKHTSLRHLESSAEYSTALRSTNSFQSAPILSARRTMLDGEGTVASRLSSELHTPSPTPVTRKALAVKPSIFSFARKSEGESASRCVGLSDRSRKLFDWDSLLADASLPVVPSPLSTAAADASGDGGVTSSVERVVAPSLRALLPQEETPIALGASKNKDTRDESPLLKQSVQAPPSKADDETSDQDSDEDDRELARLLLLKKRAREARSVTEPDSSASAPSDSKIRSSCSTSPTAAEPSSPTLRTDNCAPVPSEVGEDHATSCAAIDVDDDSDVLSIDLTEALDADCRQHHSTPSTKPVVASTNELEEVGVEQSFDFGNLVCDSCMGTARSQHAAMVPPMGQTQQSPTIPERTSLQASRLAIPSPTAFSASLSVDAKSLTSRRRLASLLESTDWSGLATGGRAPSVSSPQAIDLMYDPILRCYFDPVGKKYYTLAK